MTLDKRVLAQEIKRIIREWGQNAIAFKAGAVTEIWFLRAKQNAQEKLVLYSGALAAMVLQENNAARTRSAGENTRGAEGSQDSSQESSLTNS